MKEILREIKFAAQGLEEMTCGPLSEYSDADIRELKSEAHRLLSALYAHECKEKRK